MSAVAHCINDTRLVPIRIASEITGLSQQVIRKIDPSELKTYHKPNSLHRRYLVKDLYEYMSGDISLETPEFEQRTAVFVRVSSPTQKESLKSQKERVIKAVCEKEKVNEQDILLYECVCSSFSGNDVLQKLIEDIIANKIYKLFIEQKNRLCRIGAIEFIIKKLCEKRGVELVYLWDDDKDKTEQAIWVEELLSFITCAVNKQSAKRSSKVVKFECSQETRDRIYELRSQHVPIRKIKVILDEENHTCTNGNGKTQPVSIQVIRRLTETNIYKLLAPKDRKENSLEKFLKLTKKQIGARIAASELYKHYVDFCNENAEFVYSKVMFSMALHKLPHVEIKRYHGKSRFYNIVFSK